MNREIEVVIKEENGKTYIVFNFDNPIEIDITSDDQENIKKVFYAILEKFVENQDISFHFNKNKEDLFSEVTEKYVSHLNSEINILKKNYSDPINNKYDN
jgi:hypothetical protein